MTRQRWSTADLIDLEFFLSRDDGESPERLAARDREIGLGLSAAVHGLPEGDERERILLKGWLARRRAAEDAEALPGSIWQEVQLLLFGAAGLAGLAGGAGLAFSLLAYSGVEPLNVAVCLVVLVASQVALLLLLASSVLCGQLRGRELLASSVLYRLTGRLLFRLLDKLACAARRKAGARIAAEDRLWWSARAASLGRLRQQRHGMLLLLPVFLAAQLFGVGFNVGVLAAALLKVVGSDLAFGWQTTLRIDASSVHALVRTISLPWSWLSASVVPTPEQIEGSRLILKDGIRSLASRHLASWWPFLCLSVAFYGLLPRLALLAAGVLGQRRRLARLDFQQGCWRQILHRMRTPLVSSVAVPEPSQPLSAPLSGGRTEDEAADRPAFAAAGVVALAPDELLAEGFLELVQAQALVQAGMRLCQTIRFWTPDGSEDGELAELEAAMAAHGCKDVLVVQEAWQPPVQELLGLLGSLRRRLGPRPLIWLALVGRPSVDGGLSPVRPQDLKIWQQKLAAAGDPGLLLIELVK